MKVIDLDVYPWGHILADQFVLTDNRNEDIYNLSSISTLLADFESNSWGDWQVVDSSVNPMTAVTDLLGAKIRLSMTVRPMRFWQFKTPSKSF